MIYGFSNDFGMIFIPCYNFGPSSANGSKNLLTTAYGLLLCKSNDSKWIVRLFKWYFHDFYPKKRHEWLFYTLLSNKDIITIRINWDVCPTFVDYGAWYLYSMSSTN